GHTIRTVPGEGIQLLYGQLAATGDVDQDGVPDYATTVLDVSVAGRAIRLEVRSGVDDRPLWYVENTNSRVYAGLTGNVDLNGDGRPDVACTVPDFEGRRLGAVLAYAHDGHLLWQRPGTPTFPVGWQLAPLSLSGAGDVDGDGADDVLATGFDLETNAGLGIVLSGRTGATLLQVSGPANGPVIEREVS